MDQDWAERMASAFARAGVRVVILAGTDSSIRGLLEAPRVVGRTSGLVPHLDLEHLDHLGLSGDPKRWLWAKIKARDSKVMSWMLSIRPGDELVGRAEVGEAVLAAWGYLKDQGAPIGSCSSGRVLAQKKVLTVELSGA